MSVGSFDTGGTFFSALVSKITKMMKTSLSLFKSVIEYNSFATRINNNKKKNFCRRQNVTND